MRAHGIARAGGVGVLAALLLGACTRQADFGRDRPGSADRLATAIWADPEALASLPPTAAERDLRAVAANLAAERAPLRPGGLLAFVEGAFASEPNDAPSSLRYYRRLRAHHPTSPEALLNALADDVKADTSYTDRFSAVAAEVTVADRLRADELLGRGASAATIAYDGPGAFAVVHDRIDENDAVVGETADMLASRLVGYRTALAHARLDAPLPEALDAVEGAIRDMEARMALVDEIAVRHQAVTASLAGAASG